MKYSIPIILGLLLMVSPINSSKDDYTSQIRQLQTEVKLLRAEVDEIHRGDILQIYGWLQYFNNGFEQLYGRVPEIMQPRDKSEDKF